MSLYQNVSFPVQEHLKLFQLSGRLARRLFCIPWYFVVPHFISFNCKLLNTQFSHKEKETIQSVWSDLMTLLFPDWLTPPLLFFLYIFVIPPGWFGRIRKPLHSKPLNTCHLSTLHPYSINFDSLLQIPIVNPWIPMKPSPSLASSAVDYRR